MFKFWGSQDQEPQVQPQDASPSSWYPPFVVNSSSYTQPPTAGSNVSNSYTPQRPQSPSHVSPTEAAGIISSLKDKSVDELRKLLSDKEFYNQFLQSLDQVRAQNNVRDELQKEMIQLARSNLEKEPHLAELRNQCRIIRTTELAAALEKLNDSVKKKDLMNCYSSVYLLHRLQEEMSKTDVDSDNLESQFFDREIELVAIVQKYKKLRSLYHRRAMIHLAAKTSPVS